METSHFLCDFVFVPWVQSRGGVLLWTDEVLWVVPYGLDAGWRHTSCWTEEVQSTHLLEVLVWFFLFWVFIFCDAWPYIDLYVSWDVCGCYEHSHTEENEFLQVVSEPNKLLYGLLIHACHTSFVAPIFASFLCILYMLKMFYMLSMSVKHCNMITCRKLHWNPIKIVPFMRYAEVQQSAAMLLFFTVFMGSSSVFGLVLVVSLHDNYLLTCLVRLGMVTLVFEAHKSSYNLHK